MNDGSWPANPYLDGLRPNPEWTVGTAIIATYSADLPSVAAALLALAGRDDERGGGSRVDLAEAVESLRGKVHVLVQRGRIAKPRRLPAIAGILDQFLVDVPLDESSGSWHPKLALIRMVGPRNETSWRLWIGSRNLTSVENLDLGMLLESDEGPNARGGVVPGVGEAAERLATVAGMRRNLASALGKRVAGLRWNAPPGLHIEGVRLTSGAGTAPVPDPPTPIQEVILVSPFLDADFVRAVGGWGDERCRRTLLSTHAELRKVAKANGRPLRGFARILAHEAPLRLAAPDDAEGEETVAETEAEGEEIALGLHAKIIAVEGAKEMRMWVGSANATMRAWTGCNVEVIAELSGRRRWLEGLRRIVGTGRPLTEEALAAEPDDPVDAVEDRLDAARGHVVAHCAGRLEHAASVRLTCVGDPHPPDADVTLEAGLATCGLSIWERDTRSLDLGACRADQLTGLVQFRLSLEGTTTTWLQNFVVEPPLGLDRDRAVLARHLGPGAFLAWMRSMLQDGAPGDAVAAPWDSPDPADASKGSQGDPSADLTLEDMLSCWARDPDAFAKADDRFHAFMQPLMRHAVAMTEGERDRLHSLESLWKTLRRSLLDRS